MNISKFDIFNNESYLESNYAPLYHNTSTYSFYYIIKDNILKRSYHDNPFNNNKIKMISLSRNKNLDISYYNSLLDVVIELDTNLLNKKYKIIPYDYFIHSNKEDKPKSNINRKQPFEFEEIILNDINNIIFYIISVNFKNYSIFNDRISELLPFLKNKNIKIYNDGKLY